MAATSLPDEVKNLLSWTMEGLVSGDAEVLEKAETSPTDREVAAWLDDLLSKQDTYRDATLAILAYPLAAGQPMDITVPPDGRRGVAQHMDRLLTRLDIRCRRDVFQTIAKGSDTLIGRDRESWNELLKWASKQRNLPEIERAFHYVAKGIAATARNLPAMPVMDVSRLTYARVVKVVDEMLSTPSGGAHEQFILAALLHAVAEESGSARVETKTLSAADASARSAADVQLVEGGVVREAYEVSASDWSGKLRQAVAVLHHYQLPRVHILANASGVTGDEIVGALTEEGLASDLDVSVLDIAEEVHSLLHRLTRPGRRAALLKLYEHLVQRQGRDDLVQGYVNLLRDGGLTEDS